MNTNFDKCFKDSGMHIYSDDENGGRVWIHDGDAEICLGPKAANDLLLALTEILVKSETSILVGESKSRKT